MRASAALGLLLSIAGISCGGSPAGPESPGGLGLRLDSASASFVVNGLYGSVSYDACFAITGSRRTATIQFVRYLVLGPDGSQYNAILDGDVDASLSGRKIGGDWDDYAGCRRMLLYGGVHAPLAPTYRITAYYTFDDESEAAMHSVAATGIITSALPTRPLMTGVSISPSFPDNRLNLPFPVTLTAIGTGGVSPYQFRWTIDGFLLRDWDPNPTLVWDGTVNGQKIGSSLGRLEVMAKGDGGTFMEALASVFVTVTY